MREERDRQRYSDPDVTAIQVTLRVQHYGFFTAFRFAQYAFIRSAAALRWAAVHPRRPDLSEDESLAVADGWAALVCRVEPAALCLAWLVTRSLPISGKALSI